MNGARQKILVFDSGLGGLTVFRAIRALRPDADYLYLADNACFPYGELAADALIARVLAVIEEANAGFAADCIVIACNTASTLVLPGLRARYSIPIIGAVPAIKPAAKLTKTGMISVLATPGTVKRDYTAALIRAFAGDAEVTLVGAKGLAALCERALRGEDVEDAAILAEIAPAFVEKPLFFEKLFQAGSASLGRTDVVVLACTHYPLLIERLERLAPWAVHFIDPAPAIARRVVQLMGVGEGEAGVEGKVESVCTAGSPIDMIVQRLVSRAA